MTVRDLMKTSAHGVVGATSDRSELEILYRTAPVGLCLLDTDLRFVSINERLAKINGLSVAEHIGHTLREVVPEIADTVEPIEVVAMLEAACAAFFREGLKIYLEDDTQTHIDSAVVREYRSSMELLLEWNIPWSHLIRDDPKPMAAIQRRQNGK